MTLPDSGQISLLDIVAEFGGEPPHRLTDYYRGGGLVPDTPQNANIPTAGEIKITDFYGSSSGSSGVQLAYCSSSVTPYFRIYNSSDWQVEYEPTTPFGSPATDVTFSPDGTRAMISTNQNPFVTLYSVPDWETVFFSKQLPSAGSSVSWSPNGLWVACTHSSGMTILALTGSNPVMSGVTVTASLVGSMTWSPDSSMLAISGGNASPFFQAVNTSTWAAIPGTPVFSAGSSCNLFVNNGDHILIAEEGSLFLRIYRTDDWTQVLPPIDVPNTVRSLCKHPTEDIVIVGTADGDVIEIETITWTTLRSFSVGAGTMVRPISFSPNGQYMSIRSTDSPVLQVYNYPNWDPDNPVLVINDSSAYSARFAS